MAERYDHYGRITPESVDRMRMRIGVRQPGVPAWYREAHPDTMRHFAWSFGDDNPLFSEPDYGARSRWGTMIASPFYAANLFEPIAAEITAEQREASRGALAGLHEFHAASEFWFYRPVTPGDHASGAKWVSGVEEKESRFGGGRSVVRSLDEFVEIDDGGPLWRQEYTMIHTERGAAKEAKKESKPPPFYSPEEIEAIEAAILSETVRGSEPRYWEDVAVGDELPTLTKGPMTVTDIIGSHIGRGPGHYAWGPLRIAVHRRQAHPGFSTRNEFGGWDIVQRVHWDQEFAREIGANRIYDYGTQRLNWLGQVVTDWMGDDAWLARLRCEFRKFNYVGDVSRLRGRVTAKHSDDHSVEVELSCVNQDGIDTAPGTATVLLPTRDRAHPELPAAPADWPTIR